MPDAEQHLWNFLTPRIGKLVRADYGANHARTRRDKKVYGYPRLFNDLLSSQPLAFNLFGELAADLSQATVVARRLWPNRVERVTRLEFEWSPGRGDPRYLDNGTAADVAIFHATPSNGRAVIFVETKYHENLKSRDNKLRPRHVAVATSSGVFEPTAIPSLQSGRLQQIWFDHLLALATAATDGLESSLFALLYPDINTRCHDAASRYRECLTPLGRSTFEARTLEDVVETLMATIDAPWVEAFRDRYL